MEAGLFDLEYLQKLTYERSKTWASFLDNVAKSETLEEIDLNAFNDESCQEFEDSDSDALASMEDDNCDGSTINSEVLRNVTNTTRFSFLFNNKTLAIADNNINEEQNQLIDIFNQTLPIINEHNRQLKESGFDKILSTFDKKKIEDKVGRWLNHHNSLFGGDNTMLKADTRMKHENERHLKSTAMGKTQTMKEKIDSDDSLQSGETARYIRSSRAGAVKSYSSTNTKIKTYRMVNSKREMLYKRNNHENDDFRAVHRCRKTAHDQEYRNYYDRTRLQSPLKFEKQQMSSQKHRRKVLRKRICSNSCSNMDSSDSDCSYEINRRLCRKKCKHHYSNCHCCVAMLNPRLTSATTRTQRYAVKMSSAYRSRMYYYSHSQTKSFSTSTSSSSYSSVCENRRKIKKINTKFCNDNRPCKVESECYCCNEKSLCEEYKHIANSSTEEWYVENCGSSKKPKRASTSNSHKSVTCPIAKSFGEINHVTDIVSKPNRFVKVNCAENSSKNIQLEKDKSSKVISLNLNTSQEDTDNDWELQMAIRASRESFEEENKTKCEIPPSKTVAANTSKLQKEFVNQKLATRKRPTTANTIIGSKEVVEKLPKIIINNVENGSLTSTKLPKRKAQNSMASINEESFFAEVPSQAICNSTALSSKAQAHNRQISDKSQNQKGDVAQSKSNLEKEIINKNNMKNRKIKKSNITTTERNATSSDMSEDLQTKKLAVSTRVTSTTVRSPEIKWSLTLSGNETKSNEGKNEMNCEDQNDCTLVTSTTNIELPQCRTINKQVGDKQKLGSSSNSNRQLTKMGILIYAPDRESVTPAYNFTSDGYFTITKQHLSSFIGEKRAEKFFKYYVGRKRFSSNSTVYYIPPARATLSGQNETSSSDSDDVLEICGDYGDLYESVGKSIKIKNEKNV